MNPATPEPGIIAISFGDPGGIGPEISLKAVAAELAADDTPYLLIGDEEQADSLNRQLGLNLKISPASAPPPRDRVCILVGGI